MSLARIKSLGIGLIAVGTLAFLAVKSQVPQTGRHARVAVAMQRSKQLDAEINQEALESRFALLNNYDPLVRSLLQLKETQDRIAADLLALYPDQRPAIFGPVTACAEALTDKQNQVERFKSENAVLKNSVAYLPTAVAQLSATGTGNRALVNDSQTLLRDLLIYNSRGDRELKTPILADITRLEAHESGLDASTKLALSFVLMHARMVVTMKDRLDAEILGIVTDTVASRGEDLFHAYQTAYRQTETRAEHYRFALYIYCALLLAYVAYALAQLNRSKQALHSINSNLEGRIAERTQALKAAKEEMDAVVLDLGEILDTALLNLQSVDEKQRYSSLQADRGMQQAAGAAESLANTAKQMSLKTEQAVETAQTGAGAVRQALSSLERIQAQVRASAECVIELGTKGQAIGNVVETIDRIAKQTKLLALNAVIEAARAGVHGRGFAVVADEVRRLAEQAASATQEIAALIGSVQAGVQTAVQAMDASGKEVAVGTARGADAGQALEQIMASTRSVADEVQKVTTTATALSSTLQEVVSSVQAMCHTTDENAVLVKEMIGSASEVVRGVTEAASAHQQTLDSAEQMAA